MVRMNRHRAGGGDDDFTDVGEEPTFAARYPGTCATCRQRFAVGDPIASVIVDKRTTYHHGACRYPATAFLDQTVSETDARVGADVGDRSKSGRCGAMTKQGKPCGNAPQKGEQFCGPHLAQRPGGSRTERP